jgi:hypothetical protein
VHGEITGYWSRMARGKIRRLYRALLARRIMQDSIT